ncbi:MAG: hypothetical protein AAF572_14950 [Cyanobacteria bacterium P01_B01_bin.77]
MSFYAKVIKDLSIADSRDAFKLKQLSNSRGGTSLHPKELRSQDLLGCSKPTS